MKRERTPCDAYQELAAEFAAKIDCKPHNAYYERPAMLSLLPELNGRRVLDAGCGPGAYAEALLSQGAEVVGFDISDRMLGEARKRLGDRVVLHHLDLAQPLAPLEDATFDAVLAALCLDYVSDWHAVFREFRRVLRPGGVVVFSCGHPSFEAEYHRTEAYFGVERVEAIWSGFGTPVLVPSFRRSLEQAIQPLIDAGLVLERLHEPRPTDAFRDADPKYFARLERRPAFLCVRARRP